MHSRGPYAKGVAKRREILHVALEIFAQRGYRKTSLRALASRVNLTEAGLLHYFDSKEQLFVEILRTRDEADRAVYLADRDSIEGLTGIMRHNADVPGLVALFATLSAEAAADQRHTATPYFQERYEEIRQRLVESIQARQETGELSQKINAESAATLLLAAADGMQIQWMLDPSRGMAEHVEYLWSLLTAVTE